MILVRVEALAVGYIGANHTHAVYRCRDHALLRIDVTADSLFYCVGRVARDNGDAVVGFLPRKYRPVSGLFDFLQRKIMVLEFRFLQADCIGLLARQPVEQLRQANLQ